MGVEKERKRIEREKFLCEMEEKMENLDIMFDVRSINEKMTEYFNKRKGVFSSDLNYSNYDSLLTYYYLNTFVFITIIFHIIFNY
jgi:hypothetical protein